MISYRLQGQLLSNGTWEDIRHYFDENSLLSMTHIWNKAIKDENKLPKEERRYSAFCLTRLEERTMAIENIRG